MRRNFDQKYRDKYIAVIIDPFVKTNADIRFFVMDDVKNSTEGRKKGGFIPSLKKMLTEYISTTPLPTPEQIRDPFGLEDAFEEVGDPEAILNGIDTRSDEYKDCLELVETRNKAIIGAAAVGTIATTATAFIGGDISVGSVHMGMFGLSSVLTIGIPVLIYIYARRLLNRKLLAWQDRLSDEEFRAIRKRK